MFDLKTMNDVLVRATGRGAREAMLWQDGDTWKPITSDELYGKVRAFAAVLERWGVRKGDRVALLSENRWEWPVLWGLAYKGQEGVELCLRLLSDEFRLCMGLAGTVKVADIRKEYLVKIDKSGFVSRL